jgi:hypothetical protein
VLVVAYATASARQVWFPSLRAIRDAGPISPHEMVETVGDICSESRRTSLIEIDSAHTKKQPIPVFALQPFIISPRQIPFIDQPTGTGAPNN